MDEDENQSDASNTDGDDAHNAEQTGLTVSDSAGDEMQAKCATEEDYGWQEAAEPKWALIIVLATN